MAATAIPLRRRAPARSAAPGLRVVTPRASARVRRRRFASLVVTILFLTCFGVAATHVLIAQGQFDLARLQSDAGAAQARYDRLRLQVAELESPGRVVAVAQERLGMVPPPEVTYLTPVGAAPKPASRSQGEPAPAAANAHGPTSWSLVKPHLSER